MGAEVDLTGLDEQITSVGKSITEVTERFDNLGKSIKNVEKTNLETKIKIIESELQGLSRGLTRMPSLASVGKNFEVFAGDLQSSMDKIASMPTANWEKLFNVDSLNRIKEKVSRYWTELRKTVPAQAGSYLTDTIKSEYENILSLAKPNRMTVKEMNKFKLFDGEQTVKDLEAVKKRLIELNEYAVTLSIAMQRGGGAGMSAKQMADDFAKAKEEIAQLEKSEGVLTSKINDAKKATDTFNESVKQSEEYYLTIGGVLTQVQERLAFLKRTGADSSLVKEYSEMEAKLSKMIAPYEKFISRAQEYKDIVASTQSALTKQQASTEKVLKVNEVLQELKRSLLKDSDKTVSTAVKQLNLESARLNVMGKLLELRDKMADAKTYDVFMPMYKSAQNLEEVLKGIISQINTLAAQNPLSAQRASQYFYGGGKQSVQKADGTIAQELVGGIQEAKNLKQQFDYLGDSSDRVTKSVEAQKQQFIKEKNILIQQKYIEEQIIKYEEKRARIMALREKKQAALENAVAQGSESAIGKYLNQRMSVERLEKSIAALKAKQESLNLSTKGGQVAYEKLAASIRVLEEQKKRLIPVTERIREGLNKVKGSTQQVALAFGVMTGVFGAANFLKSLYKITGEFELQTRALGAIVNNAREANILFKQMQTLAVESPMKLMDLNKYAKQLAAFRIETGNLYDSLKMLGDISTGVGVSMDRLILAYGQVKAANYLRGQELRQFSEAGVNILGGLQEYYRVTKGINMSLTEIFDNVSKRKVLFEDVDAVLHKMTEQGGAFYNMQLIQSQTLYGQMQKLGDLFQIEMNKIGSGGIMNAFLKGTVKILQSIIQNMRLWLSLLAGIAGGRYFGKILSNFYAGRTAIQRMNLELAKTKRLSEYLNVSGIKAFIMQLKAGTLSTSAMNLAFGALGAGISIAFAMGLRALQNYKQRQEDLFNEITEMNRRLHEVRDLRLSFSREDNFEGQFALLQQLVEKAKEYNLTLKLPAEINAGNITQVFEDATKQIEEYTRQVVTFKATLGEEGSIDRRLGRLDKLNAEYAIALNHAEQLYDYWLQNEKNLNEEQQKEFYELQKMRALFNADEEAAMQKYGMNTEQWKLYFAQRMATFREGLESVYVSGGVIQGAKDIYTGEYGDILKSLDDFNAKYQKRVEKATKSIKKAFEESHMDLSYISKKNGEDLLNAFEEVWPALNESFKEFGDLSKSELEGIVAALTGLPKEKVTKLVYLIENGSSNIQETAFNRMIEKIFGNDFAKEETIDINLRVNAELGDDYAAALLNTIGGNRQQLFTPPKGTVSQMAGPYIETLDYIDYRLVKLREKYKNEDPIGQIIWGTKNTGDIHKDIEERYKEIDNAIKQIERAGSLAAAQLDIAEFNLTGLTKEQSLSKLRKYKKEAKDVADAFGWLLGDKNKSGRTESFKSEYQAMIDFIKRLNEEYEKLSKTFASDDTTQWKGALSRVLESYKDEFAALPEDFQKEFENAIENIDFTSKEATAKEEERLEKLIRNSTKLTSKEVTELVRNLMKVIGGIRAEIDIKLKQDADKRLYEQIDKMFSDYELTLELKKLDINADTIADIFNINTTTLSQLYANLEKYREKFQGEDAVNKYREYMNKLVEINDKANLEMSKQYVKYLNKGLGERAAIEIEYMRKRAEVEALPFGSREKEVLEGLQQEMKKKIDELDWKQFQSSDFYIRMFEDLGLVSDQALTTMLTRLNSLKGTLSSLSPTELKAITEQMIKIEDELIRRNPFKIAADSMREFQRMTKDTELKGILDEFLGENQVRNFKANVQSAITAVELELEEALRKREDVQKKIKAAETIENARATGFVEGAEGIDARIEELKKERESVVEALRQLEEDTSINIADDETYRNLKEEKVLFDSTISTLTDFKEAFITLGDESGTSVEAFTGDLEFLNIVIDELTKKSEKVNAAGRKLSEYDKSVIESANQMKTTVEGLKDAFDTVYDSVEDLGAETDVVTDAWKDFGDTIFDTITKALEMIPTLVTGFTSAGIAINSAMGIIGLIAEVIQLVITLAASLSRLHDSYMQRKIDKLQDSVNDLNRSVEKLQERFESLYKEDSLRIYNQKIIELKENVINSLQAMIDAEEDKKKSDKEAIEGWQQEMEDAQDEIDRQIEDFYEKLGGFGSEANRLSMAEEWTNAWYDAFKKTGDGLSGLEESFDEFLDNLFKKQILNNVAGKYFDSLYDELDSILVKEGGLLGNRDQFAEWINKIQYAFAGFNDEASKIFDMLQSVSGTGAGLEGLTQSIQGMTESTAEAMTAYLIAMRVHIAENSSQVEQLRISLLSPNSDNPIVSNLRIIANQSTAIKTLFDSVIQPFGNGNQNGACIKVVF